MSYSPASIVTSGALSNLVAIHYEREAVPNLKAQTPFLSMTKQRPLPLRQGNQIQCEEKPISKSEKYSDYLLRLLGR